MNLRKLALVLPLALAAAVPATADAQRQMEVAMQDDLTVVINSQNRDLALIQFLGMGGTHVRITIEHTREGEHRDGVGINSTRVPMYFMDQAINRVIEFGLTPQITLFWKDQRNPDKVADWMFNVVDHLRGRVNRFSVLNEPDLYMPELHRCNEARRTALAEKFPGKMVTVGGEVRAKVKTKGGTVPLRRACQRYERGLAYKRVYKPAARAIKEANPRAQVLAGETSPIRGLDWFFIGAQPRTLKAHGWAHHPFQFTDLRPDRPANNWGIGNIKKLKRIVRKPLYMTEFAYPRPNSTMDRRLYGRRLTNEEVATALVRAWSFARRQGAKQMLQFQWFQKREQFSASDYWDTALNVRDDGTVTPQFLALREYILSWKR